MWIKLTSEYVNLAHIIRVRASKSFRNGQDEWVVELEGIVKGELQFFTRYRGVDAEILLKALSQNRGGAEAMSTTMSEGQLMAGTLHDVKIT